MGLFHKKNSFLGIDFGASAIKAVEITLENQQPRITNYASISTAATQTDRAKALIALLDKMKPESKNAYVALPGSSGLITLITFPLMSKAELERAISFEARKHIPLPLEEVNISWDVVTQDSMNTLIGNNAGSADKDANGNAIAAQVLTTQVVDSQSVLQPTAQAVSEKTIQVLLVAAPKKDVQVYEEYITTSKLVLKALELETFSLARVLVGDDAGQFVIVDIGAQATNIIALDKGVIRVSRNIGVGGDAVYQSVAESMNIPVARAFAHVSSTNVLTGKQSIPVPVFGTIVDEIQRVVKGAGFTKYQAIITGGMSMTAGVEEYIARGLGTAVTVGDPWSRIGHDDAIVPYLTNMRGAFAVAAGLALRGAQEYQRQ